MEIQLNFLSFFILQNQYCDIQVYNEGLIIASLEYRGACWSGKRESQSNNC